MLQSTRWCISLAVIRQSNLLPGSVSGSLEGLECADERWSCRRKISISYRSPRQPIMLRSSQLGGLQFGLLDAAQEERNDISQTARASERKTAQSGNQGDHFRVWGIFYCGVSHHVNGVQRPHPCTRRRYNIMNRFSFFLFFFFQFSIHPMGTFSSVSQCLISGRLIGRYVRSNDEENPEQWRIEYEWTNWGFRTSCLLVRY